MPKDRVESERDADTIRRAFEAWNEGGPEAVVDGFWAPDGVYREMPGWPDAGVFEGRDAVVRRMQNLIELLGPIEVRLEDLLEADDGRFVACVRIAEESAAAEGPYTQSFAVVHRVRDGRIVEADYYLERDQALKAVGL
jgi:ketosteroid isomerase-like protein